MKTNSAIRVVQLQGAIGKAHIMLGSLRPELPLSGSERAQLLRDMGGVLTRATPYLHDREFRHQLVRMLVALDRYDEAARDETKTTGRIAPPRQVRPNRAIHTARTLPNAVSDSPLP